jgi:CubicO group peptidase (beta-lactamase class C family)
MMMWLQPVVAPTSNHGAPQRGRSLANVPAVTLVAAMIAMTLPSLEAQGPRSVTPNRELLNGASLDSLLRPVLIDKMADRYVAGSAIVVVSGDQVIYQGGFGRREVFQELPVQVDRTIWRIGSVTKVLTGLAVMQLTDRGLLHLDADVNEYLTAVKVPATFPEPVRVRHLLTHTGGFDQLGTDRHAEGPSAVRPLGEFLGENLLRLNPPGQLSVYDTYGITLAGYLVEQVSGLSYEEYLRRNIFEPLDMQRSGITVPPSLAPDVAVGYEFAGHWEAMAWEFMNTAPASTANATATDMGHLLVMLLNGGRFHGREVSSEGAVRAMLTRQFGNDPGQPGFGFTFWENWSFGIPAFSHGGSMSGFGSLLYLVPEHRFGVFIAYNQESADLANAALTALVAALFPESTAPPVLLPQFTADADLARFAGTYADAVHNHRNPDQGWRRRPFDVAVSDSGEVVFDRLAARRVGPLTFQRPNGVLVTFRENARQEITHMFVGQAVFERIR